MVSCLYGELRQLKMIEREPVVNDFRHHFRGRLKRLGNYNLFTDGMTSAFSQQLLISCMIRDVAFSY